MTGTQADTAISQLDALGVPRRDLALALSAALTALRSGLRAGGYVEVITPHLTPFPTEETARAFPVRYLDTTVYLGQSRRRYHQLVLPSLPRVFEAGPVFWANEACDGTALTQYTTVEFAHVRLGSGPEHEELERLVGLLTDAATAVAVRLPEYAYERPLRWVAHEGMPRVDAPTPVSHGRSYAVLCGDRVLALMTFHPGSVAELEADLAGLADDALGEPFVEGFRYGTPDHVSCMVIVEHLLAGVLGSSDLRDMALFPRDAAITSP